MANVKKKRLHKITMYTDASGVLQGVSVSQLWWMEDNGQVDEDIGERRREKVFDGALPAAIKQAIIDRANLT